MSQAIFASMVVLVTLSDGSSVAMANELVKDYATEAQLKGVQVLATQILA